MSSTEQINEFCHLKKKLGTDRQSDERNLPLNKAGYTAQDAPSARLKITGDGRTDGRTDGLTNGRTDGRTDTPSY